MEFEKAILDWFDGSSYLQYEQWARTHNYPVMPETQWRAKCVAAAILAAAENPERSMDAALEALRGVGSR